MDLPAAKLKNSQKPPKPLCRAQPLTTRLLPAHGSSIFPSCCPGMMLPWIPPCLEATSQFPSSHQVPKPASQQDQSSAQTGKCRARSSSSKTPAEKPGRLYHGKDGKRELAKPPCRNHQLQARRKHPAFPKKKRGEKRSAALQEFLLAP